MQKILEAALLTNGLIGLVTHAWIIGKWVGKYSLDIERQAMKQYHKLNNHQVAVEECTDCLTASYRTLVS